MTVLELVYFLLNRAQTMHKGQSGKISVIAGNKEYLGAAKLTAYAALKMGSGLVYLYSDDGSISILNECPELIISDCLANSNSFNILHESIKKNKSSVIAIGPGLGQTEYIASLVNQLIPMFVDDGLNIVCDADALRVLSIDLVKNLQKNSVVLTAHNAEFLHLFPEFKTYNLDDDESRLHCVTKAAKQCNQVILLKGHHSVVTDGVNEYVNLSGNASMATAGSGDVLTGMITSCIGQGLSVFEATSVAVYLHGLAGDFANNDLSISLVASDIYNYIPEALKYSKACYHNEISND